MKEYFALLVLQACSAAASCSIGGQRQALEDFYKAAKGSDWLQSNGWLDDRIACAIEDDGSSLPVSLHTLQ